jgi:serine O-acetyltransferase
VQARVHSSLDLPGLAALASAQVNAMFPDGSPVAAADLRAAAARALLRLEHCFAHINNKYFFDGKQAVFDHLHGDQYAMWLYFLSNQLHLDGAPPAASKKLFLLNKALHGCDIFYEIALPSIFLLVHPLGTVLGRASYQDYLLVYQRVGVGSNHDVYPQLGRHLTLRPGSSVLGQARVGDHCSVAAESLVLDRDLPDYSLYIGNPREHIIHHRQLVQTIWKA